jgi:hypothetical protein
MIPGIIPTVTRLNLNTPYMGITYHFGHDDHSCMSSHFLLEGFFDALDAQYLRFFLTRCIGVPAPPRLPIMD